MFICDLLRTPFGRPDGALRLAGRDALIDSVRLALSGRNGLCGTHVPVCGIKEWEQALKSEEGACIVCEGAGGEAATSPENWLEAAEVVAAKWRIQREMADIFAAESHEKALLAHQHGLLADEILAAEVPTVTGGKETLDRDELPRANVSAESLRSFASKRAGGTATEGNVSRAAIGAAAVLLSSESFVQEHHLRASVQFSAMATAEDEPGLPGCGMIAAVERVTELAGVRRSDVGLWEVHELSAAHLIALTSELDLPFDRVNAWGGAIARGNPASSAAVHGLGTLARQMERYEVELGVAAFSAGGRGRAALLRRAFRR
jgi:acetyl-CoA acetyltransferase